VLSNDIISSTILDQVVVATGTLMTSSNIFISHDTCMLTTSLLDNNWSTHRCVDRVDRFCTAGLFYFIKNSKVLGNGVKTRRPIFTPWGEVAKNCPHTR